MTDIVTGDLGAVRAIDVHVRTGMPGPPGPDGPPGVEGPAGPPGEAGRFVTVRGSFGHITTPDDLPLSGLIPAGFDGPGRPADDLALSIGDALIYDPLDILDHGDDWHVFIFVGGAWEMVIARGAEGPPGQQGPAGPAGPQGGAGPVGPAGAQGERGDLGGQGPPGADGSPGPAGPQGIAGPVGPQGGIGPAGARGDRGDQGERGDEGLQGPPGAQGETGPPSFPDALPGNTYGRLNQQWVPVLPLSGGTINGGFGVNGDALFVGDVALLHEPTLPEHAVTRRYVDDLPFPDPPDLSPYFRHDGGVRMTGMLLAAPGTSTSDLGIGLGDNTTGFLRVGSYICLIAGGGLVAQVNSTEFQYFTRLNLSNQQIQNLADATAAGDALNQRTADARYARAPAVTFDIPVDYPVPESGAWTSLILTQFPIPRGGNSRIMVSLSVNVKMTGVGGALGQGIMMVAARFLDGPERRFFVYGLAPVEGRIASGFTVNLFADVVGTSPAINVQLRTLDGGMGAPRQSWSVAGGDGTVPDRSQYAIIDLGPVP